MKKLYAYLVFVTALGGSYVSQGQTDVARNLVSPSPPALSKSADTQLFLVRGQVISANDNQAIGGVTVVVKGTTIGTITDNVGNYTLNAPNPTDTLIFSFVGFVKQEVAIANRAVIDARMEENAQLLGDIVIIGYGELKQEEVSSSVTNLKRTDFNRGVIGTADQLLQGKVAGLNITRSGDPNGSPSIILRGPSTFRAGEAQEPFYVIDGVPGASINLVAPEDIVSMDVLKDASATAIYGARASNGVIIITTNQKSRDRQGFQYNSYVAFEEVANRFDVMSGDEIRQYVADAGRSFAPSDDLGANIDWQDEITRQAISQNHTFSFNGNGEKYNFGASLNYFDQEGIIKGSNTERLLARLNLENRIMQDKLTLGLTVYGSRVNRDLIPQEVLFQMLRYLPTVPVRNEEGSFTENIQRSNYFNPVSLIENNFTDVKTTTILANPRLHFEPIQGLSYDLVLSYQLENTNSSTYNSSESVLPEVQNRQGVATRNTVENTKKILENYLTYELNLNQHNFKILGGYSWQEDKRGDGFQISTQGFISDALGYNNLALGDLEASRLTTSNLGNFGITTLRLISFYGRLNYSFQNTYFLQVAARRDGSSAFGENNQWATFPAISVAWQIKNMPFFTNLDLISHLKLRVGYGVSGNSLGFDANIAQVRYGVVGSAPYNNGYIRAIGPIQNANPDLRWEKTAMLNIGLDFGLLQNRLSGTIEYYDKITTDLISTYSVSTTAYFTNLLTANAGEISNRGFELTLNANILQNRDFSWNVTGIFSTNKNRVEKITSDRFPLDERFEGELGLPGQSGRRV
ncbi:MAG: SusC/RagA family TonB-linked outer membrane protein, partial [Bacteroidia bacterium]|nr:SusC/RagA family TonB-linked outer membrane protein [Bacteroidia bacterium]